MPDVFNIPGYFEKEMVSPLAGTLGGGYEDTRPHGIHHAGDIAAPAGAQLVAPGNMEFIEGKQGGTNLRSNDWWSHWRDVDSGLEYRFAHHGPISNYKAGDRIAKGEPWGIVGNVIEGTHLHMAVYDPVKGQNINWMQPLGVKRGMRFAQGSPFQAGSFEEKASKVAQTTGNIFDIPNFQQEGEVFDITPQSGTPPQPPQYPGIMGMQETKPEGFVEQGKETIKAPPTPLYEMEPGMQTPEEMKQAALNPPNMGYQPQIARPVLETTGLGAGAVVGGAAGAPLGPVGAGAGAAVGAGLGYGMGKKVADALEVHLGQKPPPQLVESIIESLKDVQAGTMMEMGGQVGGKLLQKGLEVGGQIVRPAMGRLSGVGTGAIEEGLKGSPNFVKAMRGQVSGEEIVASAKDALQTLKNQRASAYQGKLAEIGKIKKEIDMTEINTTLRDMMKKWGIKVTPEGEIDTVGSAVGAQGERDLKNMIERVWTWTDYSPLGIDTLKRKLGDFFSESRQAMAFATELTKTVRTSLEKQVPEYAEMTKPYGEATALIKDIEQGLSLKKTGMQGRVTADQTLRRLTTAMRENFELRRDLVGALGTKSGEDLAGSIAGYSMSAVLPRGLAGSFMIPEAMYAYFVNPKLWPVLAASSPRLQGEFLNLVGKGVRETTGLSVPLAKSFVYMMNERKRKVNEPKTYKPGDPEIYGAKD